MKAGLVYAAKSGIVRRLIVPDRVEELADRSHVGPGETLVPCDYDGTENIEQLYKRLLGKDPPSHRCVVVHPATNAVESVICADPDIDAVEGRILVLHDRALVGDPYDPVSNTVTRLSPQGRKTVRPTVLGGTAS